MKIRLGDLKRIIRETVESAAAGSSDSMIAYKEFLALKKSMYNPRGVMRFFKAYKGTPGQLQALYDAAKGNYDEFHGSLYKSNTPEQVDAVFQNLKQGGKTVDQLMQDNATYLEGEARFQEKYERDPMYASSTKMVVDKMSGEVVSREEVDQGRLGT
jgi:hypothetical protein